MAITNSERGFLPRRGSSIARAPLQRAVSALRAVSRLGAILVACVAAAQTVSDAVFAKRAEQRYLETRARRNSSPNDAEAAWQFGSACFDWADFSKNDAERERTGNEGIAACRQAIAANPKLAAGHYFLALNLGQLARTKTLGALRIVDEMEREFKTARDLDAQFDHAGPDRNLGLLYAEAPGWPTSIGSRRRAREHLERAVQRAGRYPGNRLCLLEAYLDWGEAKGTQRELKTTAELLPGAREELTGERWESSWVEWDLRWKTVQEKARKLGR